jgi:hypothetical protein
MGGLYPLVEEFLHVVSQVGDLEDIDLELARAAKMLWARLELAENKGDLGLAATTVQKLGKVKDLRGCIAQELQAIREQAGLTVLASPT